VELARAASDADRSALTGLLQEALAGAATMRGGLALVGDASTDTLLARWTAPGQAVQLFVGEFEGALVGLAAASAAGSPLRGLIECCYVETGARGVGVGSALAELVVRWCADQGCEEVDALALPGDRGTKQRLEAAGFTARLLTLSRRLG